MSLNQKKLLYSIVDYLQSLKTQEGVDASNIDSISQSILSEFNISQSPDAFKELSTYPVGLIEIFDAGTQSLSLKNYSESLVEAKANPKFDAFVEVVVNKGYFEGTDEGSLEYLKRHAKLLNKFKEKSAAAGPSKADLEKNAEEMKNKGNAAINAKDYAGAIKLYSEAIKLGSDGPNSHVYYSNRAAAYCHTNQYKEAVDDCQSALELSPDYVKAYSRLGLAYFFLEKYEDAVSAYERAVELEPDNKGSQDSLRQARNKVKKQKAAQVEPASPTGGAAGMPDLSSLAGMMGGGGGGGGAGGLAGLMNNPAMKSAIDQMGGPSAVAQMMKDPQMMAMAQQMMKDPAMLQQAMSMMGGSGGDMPDFGMGGATPAAPSSSSSKTGKKPFKGFEE